MGCGSVCITVMREDEKTPENLLRCYIPYYAFVFFFSPITKDYKSWIFELFLNVEGKSGLQCFHKRVLVVIFGLGSATRGQIACEYRAVC